MLEEIAKYPLRIPSAFVEAVKKARESQDSSFPEMVGIFFTSFVGAMRGIEKERGEVTEGAQAAVRGSITRTMQVQRTATNLKYPSDPAAKKIVMSIEDVSRKGMDKLPHAHVALEKLKGKLKGRTHAPLNFEEVTSFAAATCSVLLGLKKKFKTRAKFKQMLIHYQTASDKSALPLKELLKLSNFGIFKLSGWRNQLRLVSKLKLVSASGAKGLTKLKGITQNPIKNEAEIVQFFRGHILKKTSKTNIKLLVRRINKIYLSGSGKMTIDDITEFVFLVDNRDFEYLISILT